MDELLTEYQHYLVSEKMKSENTVKSYTSDLANYLYYLQEKLTIKNPQDITVDVIKNI
ncbi:MAG: site-specific integrase [Bacilli bacterium]